jgi:hypothetical protein
MGRPKKASSDPVKIFEVGKRGLATIYRGLLSVELAIQLAAARTLGEAAVHLSTAIEEELRIMGDASRRTGA